MVKKFFLVSWVACKSVPAKNANFLSCQMLWGMPRLLFLSRQTWSKTIGWSWAANASQSGWRPRRRRRLQPRPPSSACRRRTILMTQSLYVDYVEKRRNEKQNEERVCVSGFVVERLKRSNLRWQIGITNKYIGKRYIRIRKGCHCYWIREKRIEIERKEGYSSNGSIRKKGVH